MNMKRMICTKSPEDNIPKIQAGGVILPALALNEVTFLLYDILRIIVAKPLVFTLPVVPKKGISVHFKFVYCSSGALSLLLFPNREKCQQC